MRAPALFFSLLIPTTGFLITSCAGNTYSSPPPPTSPAMTVQPANQTVTAGQSATFSVTATGTAPLSYQWQKNGTAISGATSATYTTPPTTSADNGAQFNVVVSNSAGTVTSTNATLTVTAAAALTITTTSLPDDTAQTTYSAACRRLGAQRRTLGL